MANIESLKVFFYFFEVCGVHHFSFNDLNKKKPSRWQKIFHTAYAMFLLIFYITLMEIYKTYYPKNIMNKKKFMIFVMKAAMRFGLLLIVIFGIAESFIKQEKFKRILKLSKKLSMIYASKSSMQYSFNSLKSKMAIKFVLFMFMFTLKEISKSVAIQSFNIPSAAVLIGILPVFFMYSTVLAFNFYVELVNFELSNFLNFVFIASKNERQNKLFLKSNFDNTNITAASRLYQMIYEMSRLVNNVLRYTILILWSVFVITIINNIYSHLIEASLSDEPTNFVKVQICECLTCFMLK